MKVFGFDDIDVQRGELRAAKIDAMLLHFHEATCAELGWEFMSTRFSEAKAELIRRMDEEGVDPEMVAVVRGLKAAFLPVEEHDL